MGFFTRVLSVAAAIGRSWIIPVPPTSPLPARCSMGQTRSLRAMCVSSAAIRNVKMKALMFGITVCSYEGPTDGSGTWQTIDYGGPLLPGEQVLNTIVHSTIGGLAVGNFDTNLLIGRAFVYDIAANHWKELIKPSVSITAYGIWYNGGTGYTIAGGHSDGNPNGIDHGYLANWDSATQQASDWTRYDFDNGHTQGEVS